MDFLLCLSSYVGSENGKFLTPKVLAARPNLREWWVGEKIAATNDVCDDGIVDGSSAITKTMRIPACLIGRQIRIPFLVMVSRHAREFYGSRKSGVIPTVSLLVFTVRPKTVWTEPTTSSSHFLRESRHC